MSQTETQTETQTERPMFAAASASERPDLACIGYVDEIGEGHMSNSGMYVVQPISVSAIDTGRDVKLQWLYRPEWLEPGFEPDAMLQQDGGKAAHFVYQRNINGNSGLSVLAGVCGTAEAFEALTSQIFSLEEITIEGVQETLTEFFANNIGEDGTPMKFGYTLSQQRKDSGRRDERGKKIYIREDRLEAKEFWRLTEKKIASFIKKSERNEGKFQLAFDPENVVPF